jgi:branched-chain amino acid aminotransferase
MHRLVLHNDQICDAGSKVLAPGQVGLLAGWGVFSTLRVSRGVPFAFERHWERMKRDAAMLGVPFPEDRELVRAALGKLIAANQAWEATLRVVIVRNRGGIWEGPSDRPFDLIALTTAVNNWGRGVKLGIHEQARHAGSRFRGVKMTSWAINLTILEEAQRRGLDEVLLLNERGELCECTSANVFIAQGSEVLTPPLDSGCLPGVTRDILLNTVRVPGITVREKTLSLADLERADGVFITSTTRNLLPVDSIEGRPVGHAAAVRDQLEAAFERFVESYVAERIPT